MLAALNNRRWKSFPDIPTVQEMGYPAAAENALTILGPANLPTQVLLKLREGFREAMKDKDFIDTMNKLDLITDYIAGPEVEVLLRKKFEEVGKTVKDLPK